MIQRLLAVVHGPVCGQSPFYAVEADVRTGTPIHILRMYTCVAFALMHLSCSAALLWTSRRLSVMHPSCFAGWLQASLRVPRVYASSRQPFTETRMHCIRCTDSLCCLYPSMMAVRHPGQGASQWQDLPGVQFQCRNSSGLHGEHWAEVSSVCHRA